MIDLWVDFINIDATQLSLYLDALMPGMFAVTVLFGDTDLEHDISYRNFLVKTCVTFVQMLIKCGNFVIMVQIFKSDISEILS